MKKLLLILAAALCMTAVLCARETALAEPEQIQDEWTVLFYMCGSDLESKYSYATENLKEISRCVYPLHDMKDTLNITGVMSEKMTYPDPGKINVLIETGGCKEWHTQELGMEISNSALQRWRFEGYRDDGVENGFYLEETLPLQSMADPETLSDFIRWGAEHYPAKNSALILWDHGGGSKAGIFIDEIFQNDTLNLKELRAALKNGGVQLEAVVFDACMMANLETAYAVSESARWMIASEEVVTGMGTASGDWLQQLYIDPEFDGEWLGRWVCDMTQIKTANQDNEQAQQLLTWSVIDLSKVPILTKMFDMIMGMVGDVYVKYPQLMSLYTKYIVNSEHYGSEEDNMWDLASIFYMPELSLNMTVEIHRKMLNALKETVVYSLRGPSRSLARGLSFCYAVNFNKKELDAYAENCPSPHYLAFLDAISPWTAPDWVYEQVEHLPEKEELNQYQVIAKKVMLEDGTLAVAFDQDCYLGASTVRYGLIRYDEKANELISLGIMPAIYDESIGDTGVFKVTEPYMWPALEGQHIASYVIGMDNPNAKEYLCSIPIRVGTEKMFLRYGYYYEEERYEVYGMWDGYETDSSEFNRNIRPLSHLAGQEYSLLYPVFISDYETPNRFQAAKSQTIYRSMVMKNLALPAGTYYLRYVVYDMFMRPMPMQLIKFTWDGVTMRFDEGFSWEGEEELTVASGYWE